MSSIKGLVKKRLNKFGYEVHRISAESTPVLDYVLTDLQAIEESVNDSTTRSDVFEKLRVLSLSDFGLFLLSMPNPRFPKMSSLLPRMAKEEIQLSWTADSGVSSLTRTVDFVRSLSYNFVRATGRTLENATILDFGCGYGRITRLMYYFSNEDQVYAVDPWDRSIEICHADGLIKNFLLSEYLPSTLPVPPARFDLIYAFSVFTHLSEKATRTCLNTVGRYLKPDGLIAVTIRPVEYWDLDPNPEVRDRQKARHTQHGFSFLPHDRPAIDGDITYGDTSMNVDWLANSFPNFEIVGTDRSLSDPYQIYVFLRKA